MGENNWGCVKQTAAGCGCLVVAAVALPLIMAGMILVPMNRAVEARTELEATYGTQDAYVPPASGAPSPDRIGAFLEVRRTLTGTCQDFWDAEHAVADLETLEDQKEEVSATTAIKQVVSAMRPMMGMGTLVSHFFETRNLALASAGMGLGEFTYLYVLAYGDEIVDPSYELQVFGPGATNSRVRGVLRTMLRNQLEQLLHVGGSEEAIALLKAEVEALEKDDSRVPWQDGLPPEIEEALAPFRQELDGLFCGATSPLELMINEKSALSIEMR